MQHLTDAQAVAREAVGLPGDWLTGAQRVDVWREMRAATTNELDHRRLQALSPNAIDGSHSASAHLSASEVEAVHRVASDPGRLTRTWASGLIAEVGEERYTELVGVTAITKAIDVFALAVGWPEPELPEPVDGEPTRARPDGVGDVGAWVSQSLDKSLANVSRTLSLVPVTNATWRGLVDSHYSRGKQFFDLAWDRPLSRPQVELVAARTTVLEECFY